MQPDVRQPGQGCVFREAKELNLDWGFDNEGHSPACGVALGDVDRDGDLDLLVGSHFKSPWNDPKPMRLLRNEGSTTQKVRFAEITKTAGIVDYPMKVPHVEIRDFDNDGWPDLYTAVGDHARWKGVSRHLPEPWPRQERHPAVRRDLLCPASRLSPDRATSPRASARRLFYDKMLVNRKVMYFCAGPFGRFRQRWEARSVSMQLVDDFSVHVVAQRNTERQLSRRAGVGLGERSIEWGSAAIVRAYAAGHANDPRALLASESVAAATGFCSGQAPIAHLGFGRCHALPTW